MRVVFVCRSLNNMAGGVERMIVNFSNSLLDFNHDVTLLSWDENSAKCFYQLDSRINWVKMNIGDPRKKATISDQFKRALKVRELYRQINPDITICFQAGPYMAIRTYLLGTKNLIVPAERNSPSRFDFKKSSVSKLATTMFYLSAKKIFIQFDDYKFRYSKLLRKKFIYLPNPVNKPKGTQFTQARHSKKMLLCVGRLSYQKNQQILIRAFSSIEAEFPNWELVLVGEGEEYKKCTALISELKLHEKIILLQPVKNIHKYYQLADLFVLPSRWEGFPNALAEALSYGLPSIGFEGCDGVNQLIRDEYNNGWLAKGNDNFESLSSTLCMAMRSPQTRQIKSTMARHSVSQYEPQIIYKQLDRLIKELAENENTLLHQSTK